VPTEAWTTLLTPANVLGVLGFIAIFVLLWRKDVDNPTQAASYSVISQSVEYSGSVFDVAQEAMKMAQDALQSNTRCERHVAALIAHNRALSAQVVSAGLAPVPPPLRFPED
jgi:hypothetical protein